MKIKHDINIKYKMSKRVQKPMTKAQNASERKRYNVKV